MIRSTRGVKLSRYRVDMLVQGMTIVAFQKLVQRLVSVFIEFILFYSQHG
jgi:hypothetical protein